MSGSVSDIERLERDCPEAAGALKALGARCAVLGGLVPALAGAHRAIVETVRRGATVFVCGNGGSFADALHIKAELGKSFERPRPLRDEALLKRLASLPLGAELAEHLEVGIPVVVLAESHSLATAYANDRKPELCMAQELLGFICRRPEGVLLGLSTSGNSSNVVAAMSLARAYGLTTISLTGPDGGQMGSLADIAVKAPGQETPEIQENHVCIYHALCRALETSLFGRGEG